MGTHAHTHQGHLGDLVVTNDFRVTQLLRSLAQGFLGTGKVVAVHRKGKVGGAVLAHVLHDHVYFDVLCTHRAEDLVGNARGIRGATHDDFGFITGKGNSGDYRLFHINLVVDGNESSRTILETGQDTQRHIVLAGEFHGANLQDLGALAGHFQHFLEGNAVQATGVIHHTGIGRVDAIHIGVDLTLVGLQGRGQRHGGGVGTTTAKGGNVAVRINTLETGHDHHTAAIQIGAHFLVVNLFDTGLGVDTVGAQGNLATRVGAGIDTQLLQRHGQQGNSDLLAGGNQHIHFTR